MAHAIVNAADIEARRGVFRPLREALGATAFGINQLELPPGAQGPERDHSDDGQEEVYAVIAGSGRVRVDGEEHELRPGDFVFCSSDSRRQMLAGPDGLAWIGIGCPTGAYVPRS